MNEPRQPVAIPLSTLSTNTRAESAFSAASPRGGSVAYFLCTRGECVSGLQYYCMNVNILSLTITFSDRW